MKQLKQRVRTVGKDVKALADAIDLSDLAILWGFAGLFAGLWLIALPLALVVCSTLVLVAGVVRSW